MKGNSHGHSWFCHTLNSAVGHYKTYSFPLLVSMSSPLRASCEHVASSFPHTGFCAEDVWRGSGSASHCALPPASSSAGSQLQYHLPKRRCRPREKVQKPTHFGLQLWKMQCLLIAKNEDFSMSNDSTDVFFRTFLQRMGAVHRSTTSRTISDICVPT